MDLLEYQAKELFREVGIPTLPSQTIQDPRQIKQLQIPYPVVLKSQVPSGGRGKAGGVRFVANTIDAIAASRAIFHLSILGAYPEVILAEAHYNAEQELFLAIVLDYQLKCPVLLGSSAGGMNVKSLLGNLQQVAVEDQFSPFYARRLISHMELSRELIPSVSNIIQKMYYLFQAKDLDLIEINPLAVNRKGELMALDGKITIHDRAVARHRDLQAFKLHGARQKSQQTIHSNVSWLDWRTEKGKVAIICNSYDLAVLTWDLIEQQGTKPACAVTIEDSSDLEAYTEQLEQIFIELASFKGLKLILVNIWSSEAVNSQIIKTVVDYCQLSDPESSQTFKESQAVLNNGNNSTAYHRTLSKNQTNLSVQSKSSVKFVLRLLHRGEEKQKDIRDTVYLTTSLKSAVSQVISLVKSR